MQPSSTVGINRRALLSGVAVTSVLIVINLKPKTIFTKIVEQDRWILKEDDLL